MNQEIPFGYCKCGCGEKTRVAKKNDRYARQIKGIPLKYVNAGHSRRCLSWTVDAGTGCWNWHRPDSIDGYGKAYRNGKHTSAHRVVYEMFKGEIPKGLVIDHLCRNHACVNPEHLEPVSSTENIRRGVKTILTSEAVLEIRRLYGKFTCKELGEKYGVARSTVFMAAKGGNWADL